MNVFIANFGVSNWVWPECLRRGTIAVLDDELVHRFWQSGDREGYIQACQQHFRTASGTIIPRPLASRWFNLNDLLFATQDDLWIHREKDQLWWTFSTSAEPEAEFKEDPTSRDPRRVHVYHKRCAGWSDKDRRSNLLMWRGLHPKAQEFLFTEGTFQKLSDQNAAYALALVDGNSLEAWHTMPEWRAKQERSRRFPVVHATSRQRTVVRLALAAYEASRQSGTISVVGKKDKQVHFRNPNELEHYITQLLDEQEGCCALTGLRMLLDGEDGDRELRCSLDRKDSNGHYQRGNLQVVCRFANRWKGTSSDDAFTRLIELVRSSD